MAEQPNILIIWGDDIGITNVSAYSDGVMGYRTPNIDRLAHEGVRFTDSYGEQSCTAGRAAFITGQNPYRTGMTKVGMPGANVGLRAEDPTIATALKNVGYATGQFGKNHLGDRDEFLPTMHGFDEFFGNLYHLNAEEEPELRDYPTDDDIPGFKERFGPRGVIHSWANGDGTQRIEDTGALTKKRMETVDEEFRDAAVDFMTRQTESDTPFFLWFNSTHMHFRTHGKAESRGRAGRWQSEYHDTMCDHDDLVGEPLQTLDDLGIAENTIVMYSTDNGPHMNSWPDGGMTPFRCEKNSNWEGAYRVPCMVRWPGHIPAGTVLNGIVSHNDWFVTLLAAAGDTDVADRLKEGTELAGTEYKVHLDGHNLLDYLTGAVDESPRRHFFYVSDEGDLTALALRQLEVRVPRAAHGGHPGDLARSVDRAARAEDLQSAHRPVRAGRSHVEHVLRLDARPCVPAGAGAGLRRPDAEDAGGVPGPAEAGLVHDRPGAGQAPVRVRQLLTGAGRPAPVLSAARSRFSPSACGDAPARGGCRRG
ncbi:arylsulfatase [Microbacterium elymi]|uniref:Sulfatase-like hydrolase/transferase n=1 Tax=Microbacterium elymi TaxID=2909587 RepID=A0ABY5NME0_9MICO|nr:sulfatase-like hydrolase/transferase [Microbacterium elymi]UUT36284.1 sulfatase-like hydrolase/transferase [Microbacterium elymi]